MSKKACLYAIIASILVLTSISPVARSTHVGAALFAHNDFAAASLAITDFSFIPTFTALNTSAPVYTDPVYGFSFRASTEWKVQREQISPPGAPESVIRTRWKLSRGFMHSLFLDVFEDSAGLSLLDWYQNHRWVEDSLLPAAPNATVAGCPAAVFLRTGSQAPEYYVAIWRTKDTVFRLAGPASTDAFRAVLENFQLESGEVLNVTLLPELKPVEATSLVAQHYCCNEYDPTNNPYPCAWCCSCTVSKSCDNPSSGWGDESRCIAYGCSDCRPGNCTWYARYRRPDFGDGSWGSPANWIRAAEGAGFPIYEDPQPGYVLCMPGYPHVAYVTSVDPSTKNVVVLEQNGNCPGGATGGCTRSQSYSRTTYQSKGGKFIGYKGGGDTTPPDGDITSPSEGATITSRSVHLAGWAQDNSGGSGLQKAHFTAYYSGSWRQVGPDFTSSPFSFDWDMCNDGVPDGQVTLGLDIWDKAGNAAYSPRGNRHFTKSYNNCSPPADCPQSGGVILYKHNNYNCGGEGAGSGYVMRSSTGLQNVPGSFNDQASSVRVPSGWSVRLYEHSDRGGGSVCRSGDDSDFAGDAFDNGVGLNDNVSSFEVFSSPNCPSSACNTPSPSSPCNGLRINQTSSVNFSWSGNCSQYYAEYWGGLAGTIGSGWIGSTSWNPGQLWCGNYSWHVKGKSSAGIETGWSSTCNFTVVPNTPTGLTASAVSGSQINLSWNDPGGEKDGYKVYYSDGRYIGSTSSTSYQVTGLNCSASYCFYVKAYRSSFESDPSNTACATTQACPGTTPATPTRTATAGPPPATGTPTPTPTRGTPPPGNCPRNVSGYVRNVANSVAIDGATLRLQFWSAGLWQTIDETLSKPDGSWSFYTSDCRAPWRVQVTPPIGFWADHVEPASPGRAEGNDAAVWLSATDCQSCSAIFWLRGTAPTSTPTRTPTRTRTPTLPIATNWRGEYWNNETLSGDPALVRNDSNIDFEWSTGSPAPVIQADHFSARWTRTLYFSAGNYRFRLFHDDGARLWIDGNLVIDEWHWGRAWHSVDRTLSAGYHSVCVEMYEIDGWAAARLSWELLSTPTRTPTPTRPPSGTSWKASTDFSLQQGANQWYYQYWDGSTYRDMVASGDRWKAPGTEWCLLWRDGGHPSRYEAARRWRSPVAGTVRITGNARKANTGGGDGVIVSIWKNSTKLWERTLAFNDSVGYNFDLTTQVAVGDSIYFRIAQRENDYYDGTAFDPTISLVTDSSWRASTGFSLQQGANQWYYQYWDGSAYRNMVVSGDRWKAPGTEWCLLWVDGGHPSRYEAARRWRSPVAGTVRITGNARKSNTGGGDGVIVSIWKNSTKLWERTLAFNDSIGQSFYLTTQVAVGDSLYFRIAQRGNDYYDGTAFDPTITLVSSGTGE